MRHVVEHRKRANRMREVGGLGLVRLQVERQSALEHMSESRRCQRYWDRIQYDS